MMLTPPRFDGRTIRVDKASDNGPRGGGGFGGRGRGFGGGAPMYQQPYMQMQPPMAQPGMYPTYGRGYAPQPGYGAPPMPGQGMSHALSTCGRISDRREDPYGAPMPVPYGYPPQGQPQPQQQQQPPNGNY